MNPRLSSRRPAEGKAWPCKRGWQRQRDGQAEAALLTKLPQAEQPIGVPGRLSTASKVGKDTCRSGDPDSSHLLPASCQGPLCGPLPVPGRSLEHACLLLALRRWRVGG